MDVSNGWCRIRGLNFVKMTFIRMHTLYVSMVFAYVSSTVVGCLFVIPGTSSFLFRQCTQSKHSFVSVSYYESLTPQVCILTIRTLNFFFLFYSLSFIRPISPTIVNNMDSSPIVNKPARWKILKKEKKKKWNIEWNRKESDRRNAIDNAMHSDIKLPSVEIWIDSKVPIVTLFGFCAFVCI